MKVKKVIFKTEYMNEPMLSDLFSAASCCYEKPAMADFKADSMFESARLNLLEVIEERNRALNKVLLHVLYLKIFPKVLYLCCVS